MPVSTIGSAGLTSPLTGMTISSPTLTTPNINSAQIATVSGTAPLYMARAWVNFNGQGTPAIRASGNVTSITDSGAGSYTVNFTTAMPDGNYAVLLGQPSGTTGSLDGRQQGLAVPQVAGSYPTTGIAVCCYNQVSGANTDPLQINVAVFR